MTFSHSFFEDEIRCDFLVPSMVKRTWAAQMEILGDLDSACQKAGLEYFADWGTLLGTIRHGGFIPWDDDMDICMKRRDYMYLIDNVPSLLPDNYSIVSYRSSRDFNSMLCRLVSSDHYRFDPEYMHKYSGLPIALGIDIFPMDYLTDDDEYEAEREKRVRLVYEAVDEIAVYNTPVQALSERLRLIEKTCAVSIDRSGDVLTQLRALLEKMFGEVDEKDASYVALYQLWLDKHTYKLPIRYYENSIRLPFEEMSIPVPAFYDAVLSFEYGRAYMMPKRSGGAHDYPYFENHVNVLREHFGFEWPAYRFDPDDLPKRTTEDKTDYTPDNRRALFITYDPKAFENMRPLVGKYADDGYEVTILPARKFDIAADMTGITQAPSGVPDEYYRTGNADITHDPQVIRTHPSVIVTNWPYDEYNLITTVDKTFYSTSLAACCDRLVYVPPFECSTFNENDERSKKIMPLYVWTKLAAVCDEIVLHSEAMKKGYVDCLCSLSGESYRDMWQRKIRVYAGPESPEDAKTCKDKKKIMFYIGSAGFAQYREKMIEKICEAFDIFDQNSDKTEVVYRLQENLEDDLKKMYPDIYEKYTACGFRESDNETGMDEIDAYYGEVSEYATQMMCMHRPVMIMNAEV